MITCQHARQLFDRYLDGELSPSLQAELHAHQLSCSACQTELAMLEACGDVIMLDRRREPKLSDSFTDRVLMARRAQLASQPRRRNWSRTLVLCASPLAAAASIALVLTLMWPTAQQAGPGTRVLSSKEAAPRAVQNALAPEGSGSALAQQELEQTPQMPVSSFMESLLSSIVNRTTQTVEGTKNNLWQLKRLGEQALIDANGQLAAQEDPSPRKPAQADRLDSTPQDVPGPATPNPDAGSELLRDPL